MLKKGIGIIFLSLLTLCLTSCFEIIEEVNFNQDGSGEVTLTMNLSKSKTRINSMMLLDTINGYKVPSEEDIRTQISDAVHKVKEIKGISNVQNSSNFEEFIFTVSCNFTHVDALNTVISTFSSKEDVTQMKTVKHFSFDKTQNTFTRNYHYDINKQFNKTKLEDREVFKTASFTTIYRFKNSIASSQNQMARIAGSKKAIMLKVNAQDIIANKYSIKNQIKLDK